MDQSNHWKTRLATVLAVAAAVSLLAASCSATDSLLGNETEEETIDSEPAAATAASVEGDSELSGQEDTAEAVEEEPDLPSIWVRADDAAMRPDAPRATVGEIVAPGSGRGWTIVGSIFDYETNSTRPAIWDVDEPGSGDSWTRAVLNQPDGGSATMSGLARTEGFDIVVGSHGRERDQRPAVWVRPAGEQWESVDRSQLDSGAPAWLSNVGVNPSTGLVMAVGGMINADGMVTPTLWTSADGERWEAIEELPLATDGSESVQALAAGPTTSVLTGRKQLGAGELAIAFWSDDGRTWAKAEVETTDGNDGSYLGEATWFNDRFVAVGGLATDGLYRPASWTSIDGREWELQQPAFQSNDDGRSSSVGFGALRITSTDSTLYATGRASFLQQVWQSSDGTNWTPVGNIWDVRPQGVGINALATDGNQILLTSSEPAVFSFEDDFEEVRLSHNLLPVPDEVPWVADVTHDGDQWVAVGGSSVQLSGGGTRPNALSWTSTDGAGWELAERLPEASTGAVNTIVPFADGLAAIGTESIQSASATRTLGRGLIWQSSGADWDELDLPSAQDDRARIGLETMAVAGDDLLAGGWRFAAADGNIDTLLIQGDAQSAPERVDIGYRGSANERVVALCGNQSGEAVALVTVDQLDSRELVALHRSSDREWSDAEWPSEPQGTEVAIAECAYGVDGFLAAGFTETGADENVRLWRSVDGSSWEPVTGPSGFSAKGNQWVSSVAVTEAGYLLAGNDASSGEVLPSVWFGSGDDWDQVVLDEAVNMTSLRVGFADGAIVVVGSKDGAAQAYTTTLDQLVTALER